MPHLLRPLIAVFAIAAVLIAPAQAVRLGPADTDRIVKIDLRDVEDNTTDMPGLGGEVPGVGVLDRGTLYIAGDSAGRALPEVQDSTWALLRYAPDTVVTGGVHWFRTWVQPDRSLKDVSLLLSVATEDGVQVFLNGRSLVTGDPGIDVPMPASGTGMDTLGIVSVPFTFRCDGEPELLAIRFEGEPGKTLRDTDLDVSIHPTGMHYLLQRSLMHYGVFIGINLIILLLALVTWAMDRRERGWLLLALLSLVSAVDTVCEVVSEMGMLGLSKTAIAVHHALDILLLPWPMYLLIMVLSAMGVVVSTKRRRLYTTGVILVTAICFIYLLAEYGGLASSEQGLSLLNDSPWIIIPALLLATVYGLTLAWFSLDVIRLGIRLLRTKGYTRWVGGGAVASSLFAFFLNLISGATGMGLSSWLSLAADYLSYAAVPVSVAVYLAIRSAHHNRLVERQRDELDLEVQERTAELRTERDRSDALLLNILPAEVAEELKTLGEAAARHFEEASVLFTDFKGFTTMAAQVDAAELLSELNTCFKAFDDIIDKRRIEKIKTIGDAYMCAGGLPHPGHATTADVVFAALEMQDFMQQRKVQREAEGRPAFDMRVGVHSGPVVAGIVGVKKFQYDIWGDTVNTASRMESSGEVGQVNISHETYLRVKDVAELRFVPRGLVQAKGKGEMEMYFVGRA